MNFLSSMLFELARDEPFFWNRDLGSLWLPFELNQIEEFSRVKPNQHISVSGYVKWINDKTFALIPTPFSNLMYLICSIT